MNLPFGFPVTADSDLPLGGRRMEDIGMGPCRAQLDREMIFESMINLLEKSIENALQGL